MFLICSDGLSKEVGDEQIARILAGHAMHAAGLAGELVEAALAAGARDNVTAVVVESDLGGEGDDDGATRDREHGLPADVEQTRPRGTGDDGAGLPA